VGGAKPGFFGGFRNANQFMFCELKTPRSEKHSENKRGLDMGRRSGGWCGSIDFLIVVPGPFWRKVFLQKSARGEEAPTTEVDALEEKNQTHQLGNEAQLNCASLRPLLDYEVAWIAVKGQDERSLTGTPLTALHATGRFTGCKKKERPPRRP
jgi:hypothetical protein